MDQKLKIIDIMKRDLQEFNAKSCNCSLALKNLIRSKLFKKLDKLDFLPKEYKIYISCFINFPDIFIIFPDYYYFKKMFVINSLTEVKKPYDLFYRCYSFKNKEYKLILTWNVRFSIFFQNKEVYMSNDFSEVLDKFMSHNYL